MAELFLIEYKGHRRAYCANTYHHELSRNATVITESDSGESFGRVLHRWDFDRSPKQKGAPKKILRSATDQEIEANDKLRPREVAAKAQARAVARRLGLSMKLSDVEIQFDGSKMTFYYTADGRVDFRSMVKELATTFRTWIEMRQISPREESGRLGYFRAMLVSPRQKIRITPGQVMKSRDRICNYCCICVSDMRPIVDIVNWSRDVEWSLAHVLGLFNKL